MGVVAVSPRYAKQVGGIDRDQSGRMHDPRDAKLVRCASLHRCMGCSCYANPHHARLSGCICSTVAGMTSPSMAADAHLQIREKLSVFWRLETPGKPSPVSGILNALVSIHFAAGGALHCWAGESTHPAGSVPEYCRTRHLVTSSSVGPHAQDMSDSLASSGMTLEEVLAAKREAKARIQV